MALGALLPWYRSFESFPNEPIDVSIIYRGSPSGDIQYFPLISQLAHGTITDGSVKESDGTILRSFPHATILPHAVSFAAFGEYGFLVADTAITVFYFLLLVLLFRTMGVSRPLSALVACFLALQIPLRLSANLALGPLSGEFPLIPSVWGTRIPRPFVSELFLLAVLIATMRLMTSDRAKPKHWLLLALTFGLLLQGDVHSALMFGIVAPFVILTQIRRGGLIPTLRYLLYSGLLFAAVIAPFIFQRLFEHPDIPVRWGVFEVDRMAGFALFWRYLVAPAFAIALACVTGLWLSKESPDATKGYEQPVRRIWWFMAILLLASYACLPVSILILGKTIQPYHFADRANRICSYVVIVLLVVLVDTFCKRWKSWIDSPALATGIRHGTSYGVMLVMILSYFGYKTLVSRPTEYVDPVRGSYFSHAAEVEPSYREAFNDLVQYMKVNIPEDAVVASFDHQIFAWWMTFSEGHWFLVEPFVSSLPDHELETRLTLFCKLLGMSADEFIKFIQTPREDWPNNNGYVDTFWLGLAKYHASRLHTYAPINNYTEEQQQVILRSSNVWQKIIPQNELNRLRKRFDESELSGFETRTLDAIVLSKIGPESPWSPPSQFWELKFENNGFRVFTRI